MKHPPDEIYQVLKKGEKVKFAFKQRIYFEAKPKWLFITNYRIIFIDLNIGGFKSLDIPYEELKSFAFYSGIFFGKAIVYDEKGNKIFVPLLRRPSKKEWDSMIDYITERVQAVSVENPTVRISQFFFIRKFMIQKAPESAGRIKMQYVQTTTEGYESRRAISHSSDAPKNLARLTYEEAKKIVFENQKKHEQIKVLKDLLENELIDEETYNKLKEEILATT